MSKKINLIRSSISTECHVSDDYMVPTQLDHINNINLILFEIIIPTRIHDKN